MPHRRTKRFSRFDWITSVRDRFFDVGLQLFIDFPIQTLTANDIRHS
jgi:hypothetical protein